MDEDSENHPASTADASARTDHDRSESEDSDEPLPEDVLAEAERLTRHAREASDEGAIDTYREARAALLADHEYTSRVREDDDGETLVLHPEEWIEDGVIQTERIEDVDRGVEVPLSGPGEPDDWEVIEADNRALAETVRERHGDTHGATAHALADFAGNHYAKPIQQLAASELEEFREEYLPRNAWPSDEQLATLEESIRLVFQAAEVPVPGERGNGDATE